MGNYTQFDDVIGVCLDVMMAAPTSVKDLAGEINAVSIVLFHLGSVDAIKKAGNVTGDTLEKVQKY